MAAAQMNVPPKMLSILAMTAAGILGCSGAQKNEHQAGEPLGEVQQVDTRRFLHDFTYTDEHGNTKSIPMYENAKLRRFEGTDTYPFTIIPQEKPEFLRPPGNTEWTHIANAKDLIRKIDREPKKIIVMLSSKTCHPCHKAMEWWKTRSIGPYEAINFEPDDDTFEYLGGLEDAMPKDLGTGLPRIFVIDTTSFKTGEKFHRSQIVEVVGSGRYSVTYGLAEWLNQKGY